MVDNAFTYSESLPTTLGGYSHEKIMIRMFPLREKRADLDYSSSIEIIPFLSFIIDEAFGETFRLVLVQDAFNFVWVFLEKPGHILASSRQISGCGAQVMQGLQDFVWKWKFFSHH